MISIKLLKPITEIIAPIITHIINFSLTTGTFPSSWKYAFILPIPKKTNASVLSDYRPISILPALSKILEKVVHRQTTAFLSLHNLLDPLQSGFRPKHSTSTALLKIVDDIKSAMDNGEITLLTLIDASRAFDSLHIDSLLTKLSSFNFAPITIQWFSSFLKDRQQCVTFENNSSSWIKTSSGVPQGSILGPLLFSIYINDISSVFSKCKHHLFADDLQVYVHFKVSSMHDAVEAVNKDLRALTEWTDKHHLKLNPSKTQAIMITNPKQTSELSKLNLPYVVLNGTKIGYSTQVRNLGLIMDRQLTWNDHVIHITKKVYTTLYTLKKLKRFLSINQKILLVQALVHPIFDYCDIVYNDLSGILSAKLQRMYNTTIRFIFNLRSYDHITPALSELGWLPLHLRRKHHILTKIYSILAHNAPPYLSANYKFVARHGRNTRAGNSLLIPKHRTEIYSKSFIPSSIRLWNKLPPSIRNISTKNQFKSLTEKSLKQYMNM
jgi:hypothetical protein